MKWLNPEFLLLALPVIWLWWRWHKPVRSLTLGFSQPASLPTGYRSWRLRCYAVMRVMRGGALLLLVLALARPQQGNAFTKLSTQGIAIMMVLDVSGSMGEQDFSEGGRRKNRLDAVKEVFSHFVSGGEGMKGRQHDLIGLISFAGYPEFRSPLTLDHEALCALLQHVTIAQQLYQVGNQYLTVDQVKEKARHEPAILNQARLVNGEEIRTAIGDALTAGVMRMKELSAKSKIMILLTDGRNNTGKIAPVDAARLAEQAGIKIYTIGVGRPDAEEGLDEPLLQEIAQKTGGVYYNAADRQTLVNIYRELDHLERQDITTTYWEYHERYWGFLVVALVLWVIEKMAMLFWIPKLP